MKIPSTLLNHDQFAYNAIVLHNENHGKIPLAECAAVSRAIEAYGKVPAHVLVEKPLETNYYVVTLDKQQVMLVDFEAKGAAANR